MIVFLNFVTLLCPRRVYQSTEAQMSTPSINGIPRIANLHPLWVPPSCHHPELAISQSPPIVSYDDRKHLFLRTKNRLQSDELRRKIEEKKTKGIAQRRWNIFQESSKSWWFQSDSILTFLQPRKCFFNSISFRTTSHNCVKITVSVSPRFPEHFQMRLRVPTEIKCKCWMIQLTEDTVQNESFSA